MSAVGSASNGTAAIKSGSTTTVTYTPNTGFAGIDSFTYTVSDGQTPALTDKGTVTVRVMPTVRGKDTVVSDNKGTISYAENRTDVRRYLYGQRQSHLEPGSNRRLRRFDIDSASGVLSFDAGDFPNGPELRE